MATIQDVLLPDIGDFSEVEIIEILVAPGDRVEPEQSLITLESDKATMEIPAPTAGLVKEIKVGVGDKISEGDLLLTLEVAEEAPADPATEPDPVPETAADAPEISAPEPQEPVQSARSSAPEQVEVRLPDIGDFSDVPVIEVLVSAGDQVCVDQSLVTLESDKATMEIPSTHEGEVTSVAVKVGDKLNQGDLVVTMSALVAASRGADRRARAIGGRSRYRPGTRGGRQARGDRPHARRVGAPPGAGHDASGGHGRDRQRTQAPRQPGRAPLRPRAGGRSLPGQGYRGQGPYPQGRRPGLRQEILGPGNRGGTRSRFTVPAPRRPGDRLLQVRRGGACRALAHQEAQRTPPAPFLDQRPPRHPVRRGRHHRAGGLPQGPKGRGGRRRREAHLPAHPAEGGGEGAGADAQPQGLPDRRRRAPGAQALHAHRRGGGYPHRPAGPGHPGRGQEGCLRSGPRAHTGERHGPGRKAPARRHAGRLLLHLQPGGHRRHRLHPHRQRPGGGHPGCLPLRDEAGVERQRLRAAAHAAAVPVLRPPGGGRRRRRCASPACCGSCWGIFGGCCCSWNSVFSQSKKSRWHGGAQSTKRREKNT